MQHFMRHSESFLIFTSVFKFLTAACSRYRLVTFRIWRRKYLTYCDKYLSYFLLNVHMYIFTISSIDVYYRKLLNKQVFTLKKINIIESA